MGRVSGTSPLKNPTCPRIPTPCRLTVVGRTLMRTMRRQGGMESTDPGRGWAAAGAPGPPPTPALAILSQEPPGPWSGGDRMQCKAWDLSTGWSQLGGGKVLATGAIQTLLLTIVGLSPGATAQLRLCQHHGILRGGEVSGEPCFLQSHEVPCLSAFCSPHSPWCWVIAGTSVWPGVAGNPAEQQMPAAQSCCCLSLWAWPRT